MRAARLAAAGAARALPRLATLTDDFADNSRDTDKWGLGLLWWSGITNNGVSEVTGRVEVLPPASTTNGGGGYQSVRRFLMSGSSCFVRVETSGALSAGQEVHFNFGQTTAETGYAVYMDSGTLYLQRRVNGTKTTVASTPFNAANHRWWRLRHDDATDTVHLDVAPATAANPPLAGEWTSIASEAWHASVPRTGVVSFGSSTWQNVATTRTIMFDGFNTAA